MNPARQVRAHERQKLLRELDRLAYDRIDNESEVGGGRGTEKFYLDLALAIVRYLYHWKPSIGMSAVAQGDRIGDTFLELQVFPRIQAFARTNTECGYLLAEFLKKVIETATMPLYHELSREEHSNPQAVFHAPSAMAEIPLTEEKES